MGQFRSQGVAKQDAGADDAGEGGQMDIAYWNEAATLHDSSPAPGSSGFRPLRWGKPQATEMATALRMV